MQNAAILDATASAMKADHKVPPEEAATRAAPRTLLGDALALCVRLYEVRRGRQRVAGLYGILKGTGLFDDLGLRSSAVRRGIAASRAAPLRSMKGAPPEVQGSGEIVSGKHRVGPKNEVDEDK